MAYAGILSTVALIIIYYTANRSYAKKIALEYMLYIEKKSRDLSIPGGKNKLKWVLAQYHRLPCIVKTAVTRDSFEEIVHDLFNETMNRLKPPLNS